MDLSTEVGIQNFRRSLHIAFKDISSKVDIRQFIRRDGTVDMQSLIMSMVDKIGFNTLQIMRMAIETPVSKPIAKPVANDTCKKINEAFGCGYIKQILDDDADE
jgi:hypothetical protein